ncbi:hypothetical protein B296_00017205 [Ensete ventricosum]|uniref:Uncharacterized protein n=1 Tax=Ensete ventricosum TaxID=4639 RepID=A0A426ZJK1_ENSVE|nr:hypothetical protein B296_00017205 [Ensete ventricosum]
MSFVPETLNTLVTYHITVCLHVVRGPGSVVHVSLTTAMTGRPYLRHVDRTGAVSVMSVSGRLYRVRSAMLEA